MVEDMACLLNLPVKGGEIVGRLVEKKECKASEKKKRIGGLKKRLGSAVIGRWSGMNRQIVRYPDPKSVSYVSLVTDLSLEQLCCNYCA